MKQLLSDGYYDFSDCDFQPMMFVEKYKFDEGKSKPYFCQGSLIQFYAPNDVFDCPLNINRAEVQAEFGDEKDDLSDMSDEELRQAIYELEDTTMLRLGQMSREELEKEYDGIEGRGVGTWAPTQALSILMVPAFTATAISMPAPAIMMMVFQGIFEMASFWGASFISRAITAKIMATRPTSTLAAM